MQVLMIMCLNFVIYVAQSCLNTQQKPGQCSSCPQHEILINGKCIVKLEGCIIHQIGPICSQCDTALYQLYNGQCVLKNIYIRSVSDSISSLSRLKRQRIQNRPQNIQINNTKITELITEIYEKYQQNLKNSQIIEYRQIQSFKGKYHNLILNTRNNENQKYFQIIILQKYNRDTPYIVQFQQVLGVSYCTSAIYQQINQKHPELVTNNVLFDIDYSHTKTVYNLIQIKSEPSQDSFISIQYNRIIHKLDKLQIIDKKQLALRKSKLKYNQLNSYSSIIEASQINDFYIFSINHQYSISVSYKNRQFVINSPISTKFTIETSESILMGRYLPINKQQYSNPIFVKCMQKLNKQFPQLNKCRIKDAKFQIVSGTIFLITLTDTKQTTYIFKVYVSLWNSIKILIGLKNENIVYDSNYNYNADKQFLQNYDKLISKYLSSLTDIPSIYAVYWKLNSEGIQYKVVYSLDQFMSFIVINNSKQPILIENTYRNTNKRIITLPKDTKTQSTMINVIIDYLQTSLKQKITQQNIKQLVQQSQSYQIQLLTQEGLLRIQLATLKTNNNQLRLRIKNKNLISNKTCYTVQFISQQANTNKIDRVLRKDHNLKQYQSVLVQKKLSTKGIKYMFLYANKNQKKYQFIVMLKNQQVQIISKITLNQGYQILREQQNQSMISDLSNIIEQHESQSSNFSIILSQTNQSHSKAYYSNSLQTKQLSFDRKSKKYQIKLLHKRHYNILPEGFSLSKLIYPFVQGNKIPIQQKILGLNVMNKVAQQYVDYISNPFLIYSQKQKSDYFSDTIKILIRISVGYVEVVSMIMKDLSDIKIESISLVSFEEDNFSKCNRFDEKGMCLSCSWDEISYQGECFEKIQGCAIQVSNICLKCSQQYIQQGYKCYNNCEKVFT